MGKGDVNARLYGFLKDNETGLYKHKKQIIAFVHIYFCDLSKFADIVGQSHFEDGGIDVQMFSNSICVEISDLIQDGFGHNLSDYKDCFNDYDWDRYKDLIKQIEAG